MSAADFDPWVVLAAIRERGAMNDRCGSCRFYGGNLRVGLCRRSAPAATTRWATVSATEDWCGDHSRRPEPHPVPFMLPAAAAQDEHIMGADYLG